MSRHSSASQYTILEDIAPALEALGAYRRQSEAIRTIVPDYEEGWKCKLVLPSVLDDGLNVTRLTVQGPGATFTRSAAAGSLSSDGGRDQL